MVLFNSLLFVVLVAFCWTETESKDLFSFLDFCVCMANGNSLKPLETVSRYFLGNSPKPFQTVSIYFYLSVSNYMIYMSNSSKPFETVSKLNKLSWVRNSSKPFPTVSHYFLKNSSKPFQTVSLYFQMQYEMNMFVMRTHCCITCCLLLIHFWL